MSDFEQRYKTWHTYLSIIKSLIRILTSFLVVLVGAFLDINVSHAIELLAAGYGVAEIVGIIEEL